MSRSARVCVPRFCRAAATERVQMGPDVAEVAPNRAANSRQNPLILGNGWWARQGLNLWPLPCEGKPAPLKSLKISS